MGERHIIEPVAGNLGLIDPDWADAVCVREAQVGRGSGYVDLLALPTRGSSRVVLVEGKRLRNRDSSDKVLGQLVKYYSHARHLGRAAVDRIRGNLSSGDRTVRKRWSAKRLLNVASGEDVGAALGAGERLRAEEVALVIALDGYESRLARRLGLIVSVLAHSDHRLPIHVVEVTGSVVRPVDAERLLRVD